MAKDLTSRQLALQAKIDSQNNTQAVGSLSSLTTADKTSVVASVNEVNSQLADIATPVESYTSHLDITTNTLSAIGTFVIGGFTTLNYINTPTNNRLAVKDLPLSVGNIIGFDDAAAYSVYKYAIGYTGNGTAFIGGGYQPAASYTITADSIYSIMVARLDNATMTMTDLVYTNAHMGLLSDPQVTRRYYAQNKSRLDGKKILVMGDSFVARNDPLLETDTWLYKLASAHDMRYYNYGLSGSSLAFSSPESYTSLMERYVAILAAVTAPDYVAVLIGHNDANASLHGGTAISIGTDSDAVNTTFKGALNLLIPAILTAYPSTRLLMMAPFNRHGYEGDYATAMQTISEKYSQAFFDCYRKSGICFANSAQAALYDQSGTLHLNALAQTRFAGLVEAQLEKL